MRFCSILLHLIAVACMTDCMGQHTPLTSQYLFNGLSINPAYAGSRDVLSATFTHRQQWAGFEGAPITQVIGVHAPVKRSAVGLGLMAYNDRIGVSNETGLLTNYAYRIRMPNRAKLALGIGAGISFHRAKWTDVALSEANDPSFAADTRGAVRPNFSAGMLYQTKVWYMGISVPFLLAHRFDVNDRGYRLSDTRLDLEPMLTGGYVFTLNDDLKLKPTSLIRYRLASGFQGDVSANLIYREKVWMGASFRSGDSVIGMVEVLPTPQWRIGYAYDLGFSRINPYHYGSHELLVQYEFGYRIRVRDPRYF
ncbi:MAG: type IX secretion system membrane protein PorP/SprF [Flavobacteriales bacterium]|nr:type IX secretion system membrane protein PorP/SprF [Flavobacteriales bacterium]